MRVQRRRLAKCIGTAMVVLALAGCAVPVPVPVGDGRSREDRRFLAAMAEYDDPRVRTHDKDLLIGAGHKACEIMDEEEINATDLIVQILSDEEFSTDEAVLMTWVVSAASEVYCPELDDSEA